MHPRPGLSIALLALAAASLAGCLGQPPGLPAPPAAIGPPVGPLADLEVPLHVVLVGFEPGTLDTEELRKGLPDVREAFMEGRAGTTLDIRPEPYRYQLKWMFHEAPEAFAQALFEQAASLAQEAKPAPFLAGYDWSSNQKRLCGECAVVPAGAFTPLGAVTTYPLQDLAGFKNIQLIDAAGLEDWIDANRGAHGLGFEQGYTVFLLDSYTKGFLPTDTYHYYWFDDAVNVPQTETQRSTQNMRAWGGRSDFVWLDVGAAPNGWDYRPWLRAGNDGIEDFDKVDAPIWDLADDKATFHANLARNLRDFAIIKVARNPIYHFDYEPTFHVPIKVFVDPRAHTNPESPFSRIKAEDPQTWLDVEALQRAFDEVMPHVNTVISYEVVNLPGDDPAMAEVVERAKLRAGPGFVDFGYIKSYLRDHWEEYVPDSPATREYPSFYFLLEYPSAAFFAYSDGDEWGESWGVFGNVPDTVVCPTTDLQLRRPCFTEERWSQNFPAVFTALVLHELGHSIALTHAHDSADVDDKGYSEYVINWLWDSTASTMTYRHEGVHFDTFDRDFMLRGHAGWVLNDTRARLWEIEQASRGDIPSEARAQLDQARAQYDLALALVQEERLEEAVRAALRSRDLAQGMLAELTLPVSEVVETVEQVLEVPASFGGAWTGAALPPYVFLPNPVAIANFVAGGREGVTHASFPLPVPEGVKRIELSWQEQGAQDVARQAILIVLNAEGDYVGGLFNGGYDEAMLLQGWRCGGECTVTVYQFSGAAGAYNVKADVVTDAA